MRPGSGTHEEPGPLGPQQPPIFLPCDAWHPTNPHPPPSEATSPGPVLCPQVRRLPQGPELHQQCARQGLSTQELSQGRGVTVTLVPGGAVPPRGWQLVAGGG